MRASSLPFGIIAESQAFRVPENWGGMGPKSKRLPSLLLFLCYIGLGPSPGPSTSVRRVASHGLGDSKFTDTEIFPQLPRREACGIGPLRQVLPWAGHTSRRHVSVQKGTPLNLCPLNISYPPHTLPFSGSHQLNPF